MGRGPQIGKYWLQGLERDVDGDKSVRNDGSFFSFQLTTEHGERYELPADIV